MFFSNFSNPGKKQKRPRGLPLLLLAALLVSCGVRSGGGKRIAVYERGEDETELTLENEALLLRFIPGTAEILVTNKSTGTVWRTNPVDAAADPGAEPVTRALLQSQFILTYTDDAGLETTFSSRRDSVQDGRYEYALVNNGVEVSYTVGNVARTYYIPPAAPEERLDSFLEKMSPEERSAVESSYRLYDIDHLYSSDNKSDLLVKFPDLEKTRVYALQENTRDYVKENLEEIFQAAGYTVEDYEEDSAHYNSLKENALPVFNVTLRYELDGPSLLVSVPFDRIAYRKEYPLTHLNLLPYFGAGGREDEGYMVVPDGSGAMIDFNNGRQNQNPYISPVYGWDDGQARLVKLTDNRANFPAFGIQKNGEAMLCVIEEGAPSASIMADVSGRTSSYNNVSPRFVVIHGSKLNISSTNHVYAWERELPEGGRFLLRYSLCAEDGYVGMAKEYRALLLRKNPELAAHPVEGLPVAVELIGAVNKKQHLLGVPLDLPLRLTSYREMETIVRDLQGRGWEHVRLRLTGWFNGGVDHKAPGAVQLVNELGSAADFQGLLAAAAGGGYRVYGEANFLFIRDSGPFDGFSPFLDAARYINREQVILYDYSPVSFIRMVWRRKSYLASPEYMESSIRNFIPQAKKLGVENIAFRTIGSHLAGDYNENQLVRREEAVSRQRALLAGLRQDGAGIMVERGYDYILDRADFVTGMDLESQGFGIANRTIPFYQIALHGLVSYTGDPINQAEDYTGRLLKTVETGAGLFFSFMTGESAVLQETRFQQYYSNEYGDWADAASALYQQFVRDFGRLYGQTIENHRFLAPKVTVTEYAEGTQVVVNAGGIPWEYRGRIIPARSYAVINQGRDF